MNDLTYAMMQLYDFMESFGILPYLFAGMVISMILGIVKKVTS